MHIEIRRPRRWTETLDGIRWLPRMIDKARMEEQGSLGAYLFGHSPIDKELLARVGMSTAEFARVVKEHSDDAGVLGALRRHPGFDEARVRRWSERLPKHFKTLIYLIDVDERYIPPAHWQKPVIAAYRSVEQPLGALVRFVLGRP